MLVSCYGDNPKIGSIYLYQDLHQKESCSQPLITYQQPMVLTGYFNKNHHSYLEQLQG